MWEIIKIIIIVAAIVGVAWLVFREVKRHYQREELAERNMSFIESINLTGLPIVTFSNNGQPINMILDTGSNACVINEKILSSINHEIGEKHIGVLSLENFSGEVDTVYVPLKYKDMTFDLECLAVDIEDTVKSLKQEYGVNIHGLLGTGFFIEYKYILDFNEMVAYSLKKN